MGRVLRLRVCGEKHQRKSMNPNTMDIQIDCQIVFVNRTDGTIQTKFEVLKWNEILV